MVIFLDNKLQQNQSKHGRKETKLLGTNVNYAGNTTSVTVGFNFAHRVHELQTTSITDHSIQTDRNREPI